jgi:hypothetical protein
MISGLNLSKALSFLTKIRQGTYYMTEMEKETEK